MKVKMLVTEKWKLLHYGSAAYGELYSVPDDPEDLHNLWDDPAYADIRRQLTERLLAELIDSELGDPALILDQQGVAGALRDQKRMETQPEAISALEYQREGITKRRNATDEPADF